jgi:L-seryl-tRNA(Ser) seleniumtransferase
VEVGTTNRTRLSDYAAALDGLPRALLLRVHRSNFALVGFTQEATAAELSALARERGVPLLHDLGSGALQLPEGLAESTAARSLLDGADLVLISGDKLLGGPQAGILLGRRDLVEACRKHPLARALRADRMMLAALEATLQLYRTGRSGELPVNEALGARADQLSQRATRLALDLSQRGVACAVVESEGRVGGGSIPLARLPGYGVAVEGGADLLGELRRGDPPVIALLREDRVVLDVRCAVDVGELAAAVAGALGRTVDRSAAGDTLGQEPPGSWAPDETEV